MVAELVAPTNQRQGGRGIGLTMQVFELGKPGGHGASREQRFGLDESHARRAGVPAGRVQHGLQVAVEQLPPGSAGAGRRPRRVALGGDHGRAARRGRPGPGVEKQIHAVVMRRAATVLPGKGAVDVHEAAPSQLGSSATRRSDAVSSSS